MKISDKEIKFDLDKTLKIVSIVGILAIAVSSVYYFIYRSVQKDKLYEKCINNIRDSENLRKKIGISLIETKTKEDCFNMYKK